MNNDLTLTEKPKFYHFSQNNSGGSFHIDERVAHHVIIEANSAEEANQRAESVGIYFNGCIDGRDCDCCGDRWSSQWGSDQGDLEPLIYGDDPSRYEDHFTDHGEPYCHVYYLDGLKKTYRTYRPAKDVKRLKNG